MHSYFFAQKSKKSLEKGKNTGKNEKKSLFISLFGKLWLFLPTICDGVFKHCQNHVMMSSQNYQLQTNIKTIN